MDELVLTALCYKIWCVCVCVCVCSRGREKVCVFGVCMSVSGRGWCFPQLVRTEGKGLCHINIAAPV